MNKKLVGGAAAACLTLGVVSAGGLSLVMEHEGLRTETYVDPVGIPTVCYGHTGEYAVPGASYTEAECEQILADDIKSHWARLDRCIDVPLNQNQQDALISLAFNIGTGAACKSTLVRKLNAGDYIGAANEFPRWVYAGGKKFNGLVRRRHDERELFLSPVE